MESYLPRALDAMLDTYQPQLPAVEIYGARGVGKTQTAMRRAVSSLRLDLPTDQERFKADPAILNELPGPVLIDEWSRVPESWDMVRRAVDDGAPAGRFLLTGSASVPKGVVVHSGAGRIVRMRMRPLTLAERGVEQPSVSLADLLTGQPTITGQTGIRLPDYVREITSSGFPGIRSQPEGVRRLLLDSYISELMSREFTEQGHTVRKPNTLQAWLAAYGAATASTATYNTIMEASTSGQADKPSKSTTIAYRDTLWSLWMLDPLDAWLPTRNRLDQLGQSPKHFLVDPAIACRLLNLSEKQLLQGDQGAVTRTEGSILGALFEHLATLSLRVYAQVNEAEVYHLRTHRGDHAIDMIIQSREGGILPVEVKLTQSVSDDDIRHIIWLREKLGSDYLGGMILTTGEHAYRRHDGIAVVPLSLLGA